MWGSNVYIRPHTSMYVSTLGFLWTECAEVRQRARKCNRVQHARFLLDLELKHVHAYRECYPMRPNETI